VSARQLLNDHRTLTPLFTLLEETAVQNDIRYGTFSFSYSSDTRAPLLELAGEGRDYQAVALQARVLRDNPYLSNPIFSQFRIAQNGDITFLMSAVVDTQLLSYRTALTQGSVEEVEEPEDVEEPEEEAADL
jgi:hypothetical protein